MDDHDFIIASGVSLNGNMVLNSIVILELGHVNEMVDQNKIATSPLILPFSLH